jgi:glucosamine 6-phosphate synthetase-like amidotransferase/phosphosugar isomerase protein
METLPRTEKKIRVDTEIFLSLLQEFRKQNASLIEAVRNTYRLIKGTASVSVLFADIEAALLPRITFFVLLHR